MIYLIVLLEIYLFTHVMKKYQIFNYKSLVLLIFLNIVNIINYVKDNNELLFISGIFLVIGAVLIILYDIKEMEISSIGLIFLIIHKLINLSLNKIDYSGIIYLLIIFVILILIMIFLKKELLGFGDIKLYLVIGFSYSLMMVNYLLIISAIIGLLFSIKDKRIPFGPSIMIAYLIIYYLVK